ncbi:ATP-binding cassette sub-family C member 9 [Holothuria leucospilota]|uniref:ATP-binding cassette sub-family C member 9 n=1 Tax=Holothuria leucospilota TaxID=206669 RepID=A0A9Q1CLR5_HOLLE|nr:ATP-binding cassette sub-family C member 9 [Holothuria leucospilota]
MGPAIEKFNWFCGQCNHNQSNTTSASQIENCSNFDDFEWNKDHTLNNACFVNLVATLPHLLFILVGSLSLVIVACCLGRRQRKCRYLIKLPGHNVRWLLNYFLLCLSLIQFGEGLLTDLDVNKKFPTQPFMYIPGSLSLVAAILTIVYYHHFEFWQRPRMSFVLLFYWLCAIAAEVLRLLQLKDEPPLDKSLIMTLRFDVTLAALVLYSLYALIELNLIRSKACYCISSPCEFPEDLKKDNMRYLQGYTNLLSTAIFWWMNWIFKKGYKEALEITDLGVLSRVHSARYHRDNFERALKKEERIAKKSGKTLNLYKVYFRAYGWRLGAAGVVKFFGDTLNFVVPVVLGKVIEYAGTLNQDTNQTLDGEEPQPNYIGIDEFFKNGIVLALVLFIVSYTRSLCLQLHYHIAISESAHVKAAIQASVYDKSLRLSTYTISGGLMTTGQITNHMSVDAQNILMVFQWVHYCWSIPYQLIGYLVLLYKFLGVTSLIGSVIFFICIPIQTLIARKLANYQKKKLNYGDLRLKQTNEMLQGMKLIKLYAWEEIFLDSVGKLRGSEISMLLNSTSWRVMLYTITTAAPLLVTLVCYGLYGIISGKALTPDITFSSLSIFNNMFVPLIILPQVFTFYANAIVSTGRLRTFFSAPEVEENQDGRVKTENNEDEDNDDDYVDDEITSDGIQIQQPGTYRPLESQRSHNSVDGGQTSRQVPQPPIREDLPKGVDIKVVNGNFSWDSESSELILSDMNIEIPAGKLTMVVGQVGSGKSSLLAAFLGEMSTKGGFVQWNSRIGSVAYAAQKAWLLNASLKDNILFGNELDEDRYKEVIKACSLQPDIDILPGGDQTEIGEKGINLSGGQKQRVSVARAIYSPHAVVLLDDPLSALDAHVGAHLFQEGIINILLKQGRTVVLVTHQLQYLNSAHQVIVLKDGRIQIDGTYASIKKDDPELAQNWSGMIRQMSEISEAESEDENATLKERKSLTRQVSIKQEDEEKLERAKLMSSGSQDDSKEDETSDKGKLIEKEERVKGSVSWRVYWSYMKTFNIFLFLLCISLAIFQNASTVATNFVLSDWTNAGANLSKDATDKEKSELLMSYLPWYGGLSVFGIILQSISTAVILLASLRAAKNIHQRMLKSIICSPMRFFDTTPVGRILNRFSSDTQVIDLNLGQTMNAFFRFTISCIGAIVVNAIVAWYFIIAIIPVVIFYLILMKYFISTSRELQRLESISRSPVFAHFSESLGGLTTIRAYDVAKRFEKDILQKIEKNNTAYLYLQTSNRWLGTRLDFIGALIVLLAGVVSLIACSAGQIPASDVGLAITYLF